MQVTSADGGQPRVFSKTYEGLPPEPQVELALDGGPYQVAALRIVITKLYDSDPHVHVRELTLR